MLEQYARASSKFTCTGTKRPALGSGYLPTCATHLAPLVPTTRLRVLAWWQYWQSSNENLLFPAFCSRLSSAPFLPLNLRLHLHSRLGDASVAKDLPGAGLSLTYGCHRHSRLGWARPCKYGRSILPHIDQTGQGTGGSRKGESRIQPVQGFPSRASWITSTLAFACCSSTRVTYTTANCHVQPPAN